MVNAEVRIGDESLLESEGGWIILSRPDLDEKTVKAANKKSMEALKVFTELLRFLKNDALKTIKAHPAGGEFTASDFTWVLIVPAILDQSAKQFMIEAAIQAGLVTEATKVKLMFVLTSEAALTRFITQKHCIDQQDQCPGGAEAETSCNDPPGGQVAVKCAVELEETKVLLMTRNRDRSLYLVVNCEDKTFYITMHEVLEGGVLKKLHDTSQRYLEKETVDEKFERFLREIFSDVVWDEYKQNFPIEFQKMMQDFSLLKQVDEDFQINCPDDLRELAQKKKEIEMFFDSVQGASWNEGIINISREKLRSFFCESLQSITKCLPEVLNKDPNIVYILLVGTLTKSQILHQQITDQFGHQCKVLCPLRPQEVTLKGAIELGRNPKLVTYQKKGQERFNCFFNKSF